MSDFSEIENELKKLQPLQPSAELFERMDKAIVDLAAEEKIVRPDRFRLNWMSVGLGLGAAAVLLLFLHVQFEKSPSPSGGMASTSPRPETRSTSTPATFIPAGATQVVYNTRDEGLHFAEGSTEPVRRVRSRLRETLRWQNPTTGASLRVSYPSEQVEFIPVSGQ
jgi:hypothetical protein